MFWISKKEKEAIVAARIAMQGADAVQKECKIILGSMILANAIETGQALDATTKYVTGRLKVSLTSLHSVLREKHMAARFLKAAGKAPQKPSAPDPDSQAATPTTQVPPSGDSVGSVADSSAQTSQLAKKRRLKLS